MSRSASSMLICSSISSSGAEADRTNESEQRSHPILLLPYSKRSERLRHGRNYSSEQARSGNARWYRVRTASRTSSATHIRWPCVRAHVGEREKPSRRQRHPKPSKGRVPRRAVSGHVSRLREVGSTGETVTGLAGVRASRVVAAIAGAERTCRAESNGYLPRRTSP